MKNLSLLVLFFCTFNYSFAQVEFPKLNATWCYTASGDFGEPLYNVCFSPDSLIEINDLEYSRVIGLDYIYDTIYYREENRKLYILPEDSINEILLCDFNLNMGDKFMKPHWGWFENESALLTVYGVDSIVTLDGVTRKIIYLYTETGPSANTYWIEGIGDMSWLFLFPNYYGSLSGGYHFLCYGIDGEFIYPEGNESYCSSLISTKNIEQKKSVILFPNPTYGKLSVSGIMNYKSLKIYNSWGQEFSYKINGEDIDITHFRAGVYLAVITDQNNNQYFGKIAKL